MFRKKWTLIVLVVACHSGLAALKDPTEPAVTTMEQPATIESSVEEPKLSAIWISSRSRRALINGVQVATGQTIAGDIKVIRIHKNTVTIQQNGKHKILQLNQRPFPGQ